MVPDFSQMDTAILEAAIHAFEFHIRDLEKGPWFEGRYYLVQERQRQLGHIQDELNRRRGLDGMTELG